VRPCPFPYKHVVLTMCCGHSEEKYPKKTRRKASGSSKTGFRTSKATYEDYVQMELIPKKDSLLPSGAGAPGLRPTKKGKVWRMMPRRTLT